MPHGTVSVPSPCRSLPTHPISATLSYAGNPRQPPTPSPVPRECCARALKPKSRKFGPFPAAVPPSTTPQGMHFSYPHDITASHSVRSINRSRKEAGLARWEKKLHDDATANSGWIHVASRRRARDKWRRNAKVRRERQTYH